MYLLIGLWRFVYYRINQKWDCECFIFICIKIITIMSSPFTKMWSSMNDSMLICRGCLEQSGEMKNMYEWGLNEDYSKITETQMIKIEGLSEMLCSNCEDTLMVCKRFRTQCQQSDAFLKDTAKKRLSSMDNMDCTNEAINTLGDDKLIVTITAPNMTSKIHLTCPFTCKETFIRKNDLLIHLVKTHQYSKNFVIELRYNCSYEGCPYNHGSRKKWFSGRKSLNQHFNKVHRDKIFNCASCNSGFSTNTDYMRHLKGCNMQYLCHICNISYSTNEKYLVHLLRKHPEYHKQYKMDRKAEKRKSKLENDSKKVRSNSERISEYICDSPKRTFATQTLNPVDSIKNDVSLSSWRNSVKSDYETKTDEISTQTVFEDLLSLKSQTSEDESLFFSETVSLSDIQTQTFSIEFGLSRSNKETITSETQSPDLSIKETQTCVCLYDSPKLNFRLFDSVSSSPSHSNLTSTETQTAELRSSVRSDVLLSFNSTETQTCFDETSSSDL